MCKQIERVKVDGMVVGNSTTWFHFVAPFLLLFINFNFFLSNSKTQYEIIELCYDLHLI
jgi:hypothetical protein